MASEFTRKVQKIKDILKFNSMLADDGDVLLTKDGEVYTQVNGKVKQLSNPNYGKDNANKILSVSDTGDAVPIPMPNAGDVLDKDNTFTGSNTFNKKIIAPAGIQGNADSANMLNTRTATFTDFAKVATNMNTYSGQWCVGSNVVANSPVAGMTYYLIEVIPDNTVKSGIIRISQYGYTGNYYYNIVNGGVLSTWNKVTKDSQVMHNSGNETASGDKTFNGQTTLLNGNFGLRVTNSGIFKTTDAGNTWAAL